MTKDWSRLREETPGCQDVIHFNNAGAAFSPRVVMETLTKHLALEQTIGGYEAQADASQRLERFYSEAARLIGADASEIAYVENATRAWDMVFYGTPFKPGDRVLTGRSEYASNFIAMLQLKQRLGIEVVVVPDNDHGEICVESLEKMIDGRTKMIALTHVPTNNGLINPADEVGRVAKKHGIPYLLDTCQSLGQMPIDVNKLGCDFLCATGRKYLRGPRGTGFLYVRRQSMDQLEPPFLDLLGASWTEAKGLTMIADAKRFETWERFLAGQLALGKAISYAMDIGLDRIEQRVGSLAQGLRGLLSEVPGVKIQDRGLKRSGLVTLTCGRDPTLLRDELRRRGINTSVSLVEYGFFDIKARCAGPLLRASLHYYNTEDEVQTFVSELRDILIKS